jgi:hypothetical protein
VDDNTLDDLLRRLTTLFVKLDESYETLVAMHQDHHEAISELRDFVREQRTFNQEQLQINARLETLMTEVFRQRGNGREA